MKELHQMQDKFNEIYATSKADIFTEEMFTKGSEANTKWLALAATRIANLNETLSSVTDAELSAPSYVETVDILVSLFDDVILECAELTGKRTEIENTLAQLVNKATANATRDAAAEHVFTQFVDALNSPASGEISSQMAATLLHDTNPLRLGFSLYEKFCAENPLFTDVAPLDYLKIEATVRRGLITGDNAATLTALEKLLNTNISTPEKYLLASLNSFYNGFEADAIRALEIGLNAFPGNERLTSAKGALES
jgi:hypothetical protein